MEIVLNNSLEFDKAEVQERLNECSKSVKECKNHLEALGFKGNTYDAELESFYGVIYSEAVKIWIMPLLNMKLELMG